MNDKVHCRDNCRYHYTLIRELIHNQSKKPNFIFNLFTQFMLYLCVVLVTIIIYNTYMIREFVNDQNFLNFTIDQIHHIRHYFYQIVVKHYMQTSCDEFISEVLLFVYVIVLICIHLIALIEWLTDI